LAWVMTAACSGPNRPAARPARVLAWSSSGQGTGQRHVPTGGPRRLALPAQPGRRPQRAPTSGRTLSVGFSQSREPECRDLRQRLPRPRGGAQRVVQRPGVEGHQLLELRSTPVRSASKLRVPAAAGIASTARAVIDMPASYLDRSRESVVQQQLFPTIAL